MASILSSIGRASARRPWVVVAAWLVILVVLVGGAFAFAKPLATSYSVSGLQSITTLSTVDQRFGGSSDGGQIVFATKDRTALGATESTVLTTLADRVARVDGVEAVANPFASAAAGAAKTATTATTTIAPDRKVGYMAVTLADSTPSTATSDGIASAVTAALKADTNLSVAADSDLVPVPDTGSGEGFALLIGFAVLLITFGALLAAGLPLVTAVIGLGVSLEAIHLITALVPLDSIATVLATLLGLAVGIDYSLFIVNRHRRQVRAGMGVRDSIPLATGTAGSAVLFAAATVIIALAGLSVIRIGFLTQMGLAGAGAVFVALLMSLTLTPALLRLIGLRVLSPRARKELPAAPRGGSVSDRVGQAGWAHRWLGIVSRRPLLFAIAAVVLLGVVALPAASMRTALPNDGGYPTSTTARQAFDLKADGFGVGINAPVEVLAEFGRTADAADVASLTSTLSSMHDVSAVIPTGLKGDSALFSVIPKSGPGEEATTTLVTALRAPGVTEGLSGSPALSITGTTAIDIDVSERVTSAFPLYLALIAAFAFVLLILVFRSILVPVKAVVGFLLSLGATLGGVVAVFQWGWLGSLFHLTPGPLLSFLPVIVTGVLFGLSMDYEMFLVSGMRERAVRGEDARTALTGGFQDAAGVVLAAGAIMVAVFGSGAFASDPTSQAIAFALAIGVLFDVLVVRMTFVPAVLFLLGRAAWWFPRALRWVPAIDVEGAAVSQTPAG